MTKTIEAKAVISAADQTGNTFDKIAGKMKSIEKAAKSFEGIKAPRFAGDMVEELRRLNLSERQLNGVRKSYAAFDDQLKAMRPGVAHYMRAHEEYKGKVVDHWREIKAGTEEADRAQKNFFKNAGHFARHTAGHVIGGLGAAYVAGHAIKSVAEAAGARNREGIREEIAGFTPEQQSDANKVADEISMRHPSLSRTDVLEDLRKNTSRLGTLDRAKEMAETYAKFRIFNQINGGDAHEGEQIVRAAEGAGAANTPEQFKSFLNGFAKAKARNPDYTGEEFAKDFKAAGVAKYGFGKDYMENVFPVLASHTPGFGVKLATSNSAMVGTHRTKKSTEAMTKAGLLDKDGNLVDQREYQSNPDAWIQHHVRPELERMGVKFSEEMSTEDKQTVAAYSSKTFSAKNTADMVTASLLDHPLVEKYRQSNGLDIDSVDRLAPKDAGIAWQGVTKQLGDLGTAAANTSVAISGMNDFGNALANMTHFLQTGEVSPDSRGGRLLHWMHGDNKAPDDWGAGAQPFLYGRTADDFSSAPASNLEQARRAFFGNPVIRTTAPELTPTMTYGTGVGAQPAQSLEGANVQATLTGSANVAGSVDVNVKVEAGSSLIAIEDSVRSLVAKVSGMLQTNGPGSTGSSSPDGAAPVRPSVGTPSFGY